MALKCRRLLSQSFPLSPMPFRQALIRYLKSQTFPQLRPHWQAWHYRLHYDRWQRRNRLNPTIPEIGPRISLILTTSRPFSNAQLQTTLDSLEAQTYRNYEIQHEIQQALDATNLTLTDRFNQALSQSTGDFVARIEPGDRLDPNALAAIAEFLNANPNLDFIYSDEDQLDRRGKRHQPVFKPDWCPDSLLSRHYTGQLALYRTAIVQALGGFRSGYEGSEDYDLTLRITEKTTHIGHLPQVLYHRNPVSLDSNRSNSRSNSAQRVLQETLRRRGEPGEVVPIVNANGQAYPGLYTIRYHLPQQPLVSIIIPTRDLAPILDRCLSSIDQRTTYPNFEILIVDNGSQNPDTFQLFDRWQQRWGDRLKVLPYDIPFNYSKLNNFAATQAKGDYLLFLNNDTEVITPDWLTALVEQAQHPRIGAVGAKLLYPDRSLQHAGVILGIKGGAGHGHRHFPPNALGYQNQVVTMNNYSAVTAACLLCRKTYFQQVNGFDEDLAIDMNDVDFCLKLQQQGYFNLYLPHVQLYHHESKSRGFNDSLEKRARARREVDAFRQKWQGAIAHDPCYSPNLTRDRSAYTLRL